MIAVYVIVGIFAVLLGLALVSEVFNKVNYKKEMRQAKLDRYKRTTEEMMKPSILKSFIGFRPYMRLNEEEEDEEEEDEEEENDEDGMEESNN